MPLTKEEVQELVRSGLSSDQILRLSAKKDAIEDVAEITGEELDEPSLLDNFIRDVKETATGIGGLFTGLVQEPIGTLGAVAESFSPIDFETGRAQVPDVIEQSPFFALLEGDRSFGEEAFERPFSTLLDALGVSSLGAGAAAATGRGLQAAGRAGGVASRAGRTLERAAGFPGTAFRSATSRGIVRLSQIEGDGFARSFLRGVARRAPFVGSRAQLARAVRRGSREAKDQAITRFTRLARDELAPRWEAIAPEARDFLYQPISREVKGGGELADVSRLRAHLEGRQNMIPELRARGFDTKPLEEFTTFLRSTISDLAENESHASMLREMGFEAAALDANRHMPLMIEEGLIAADQFDPTKLGDAFADFRKAENGGTPWRQRALERRGYGHDFEPVFMSYIKVDDAMNKLARNKRITTGRFGPSGETLELPKDSVNRLMRRSGRAITTGEFVQDPIRSLLTQMGQLESLRAFPKFLDRLAGTALATRVRLGKKGAKSSDVVMPLDFDAFQKADPSTRLTMLQEAVEEAGLADKIIFSPDVPAHLVNSGDRMRSLLRGLDVFKSGTRVVSGRTNKDIWALRRDMLNAARKAKGGHPTPRFYAIDEDMAQVAVREIQPRGTLLDVVNDNPWVRTFLDKPMSFFTRVWLAFSPRYVVNNAFGNALLSVFGGSINPANYARAFKKEWRELTPMSISTQNIRALIDDFGPKSWDSWVTATGIAESGIRRIQVPEGKKWKVLAEKMSSGLFPIAAKTDDMFRRTFFIKEAKKSVRNLKLNQSHAGFLSSVFHHQGVTQAALELMRRGKAGEFLGPGTTEFKAIGRAFEKAEIQKQYRRALDETHKFLIDFGDLSQVERAFTRRLYPFVSWIKGVAGMALRAPFESPIKTRVLQAVSRLGHETTDAELAKHGLTREDIPVWWKDFMIWPGAPEKLASFEAWAPFALVAGGAAATAAGVAGGPGLLAGGAVTAGVSELAQVISGEDASIPLEVTADTIPRNIQGPEGIPAILFSTINPLAGAQETLEAMMRLVGGGGSGAQVRSQLGGGINPVLKVGLEQILGYNLFTGKPYRKIEDFRVLETGDRGPGGETITVRPPLFDAFLEQFPQAQVVTTAIAPFVRHQGGDMLDVFGLTYDPESRAMRDDLGRVLFPQDWQEDVSKLLGFNVQQIDRAKALARAGKARKKELEEQFLGALRQNPDAWTKVAQWSEVARRRLERDKREMQQEAEERMRLLEGDL